jgi:RNA polymerase sigma-70 factor (ECF subfamily)
MSPPGALLKLVPAAPPPPAPPPEFSELFRHHHAWVAALASRLCGRRSEVEDIVQDVFVVCARKVSTITSAADARPWLRTVTVRVVRKRLRRQKWRMWFRSTDDGLAELPYRGLAPDERAMLEGLYGALRALPLEERLAWTLRRVEGATFEEVARGCDCSLATAKRRVARATRALEEGGHVASED